MSQLTYIDLNKILAPIFNCTICDEVITTAEVARIVCYCKDDRYFCSNCLCNWSDSCGLQFPPKEPSYPVCRMKINSREVRRGDGPTVLRSREELLALEIQYNEDAATRADLPDYRHPKVVQQDAREDRIEDMSAPNWRAEELRNMGGSFLNE